MKSELSELPVLTLLSVSLAVPAIAQQAGEATYKAKCAMCHGADGLGNTPVGKNMKVRSFKSPEDMKASRRRPVQADQRRRGQDAGLRRQADRRPDSGRRHLHPHPAEVGGERRSKRERGLQGNRLCVEPAMQYRAGAFCSAEIPPETPSHSAAESEEEVWGPARKNTLRNVSADVRARRHLSIGCLLFVLFFAASSFLRTSTTVFRLPAVPRSLHRPEKLPGQRHHRQSLRAHERPARHPGLRRLPQRSLRAIAQRENRLRLLHHLPRRRRQRDDGGRSHGARQSQ